MKAFDIKDLKKQPEHGDVCKVKKYDTDKSKTVTLKTLAVFDARRGVFYHHPGNTAEKQSQYKANRVRNVTEFEKAHKRPDTAKRIHSGLTRAVVKADV